MATPTTTTTQDTSRKHSVAQNAMAAFTALRQQAIAQFLQQHRIQPLWRDLTLATDQLLHQAVTEAGITVIAVGGYGRRELFPFSDVDVLILLPEKADTQADRSVIDLLQSMWDQQVPVSHATRTIAATIALAQTDATVSAALMDARYIAGDRSQYVRLKRALKREVFGRNTRAFVEAKLAERDARHARYGDSRFMLEPNIKEGKGGLRDLQTLNWLTRDAYGVAKAQQLVRTDMLNANEWRHYRQAYLFFSTLRAHVHLLRGRADERLSFDMQTQLATMLGFRGATPEQRAQRLMLRYFQFTRAVGNMTRILCALLEEQQLRAQPAPFVQTSVAQQLPEYLTVDHGRLNFSEAADPLQHPYQMLGLFAQAQHHGADIHPRAQLALSRLLPKIGRHLPLDGESNRLFLDMLLSRNAPDTTLRRMNEMNVLAAIVPEFGRITGQMQYDGYHTYTVDEHILMAIANLHQFESGALAQQHPLATALTRDSQDRAVMYVSMLCHDIAKGRGGAHADKGAQMAQHVARRLGLNAEEISLVGWLVKHHALLSDAAFKRDLDDEKTIQDFCAQVQSPQRLRLLLLITAADIKAVGPTIFNGWKGALMRTLYHRAMAAMGASRDATPALAPQDLIAQWNAQPDMPALHITHDTFRAVTEITCCVRHSPHLFATLAGVMAWLGASIVSARIQLLGEEAPGAALAELHIQNLHGESFADDAKRLKKLPQLMVDALAGKLALEKELPTRRLVARGREVPVRAAVFIDNTISAHASVIEVNARDRLGLLYDILRAIEACGLQVMSAQLATYGQLAVDVFYVKDAYGHALTHPVKQQQLQQKVLAAIGADAQDRPA